MKNTNEKKHLFAAFGSHCIDYYENLDGGTPFAGGGPLNTAVHMSRLGIPSLFAGCVGSDAYGALLLREMIRSHVDTSCVHVVSGNSAVCEVYLQGNERILGDYAEGVMKDFRLSEKDLDVIAAADLCLCDLWGNQEDCFPLLKAKGARIAFDSADAPDDERCRKVLPYVDILFFSSEEDSPAVRRKMQEFHRAGVSIVVTTFGAKGSAALDETGFTLCEAEKTDDVLDSMGAGDTYIAGFLHEIILGRSIYEAMKKGSSAAAETLKYHGAFPQEANHGIPE